MSLKMDETPEPVGLVRPQKGDVWNDYEWVTPERYERQRKTGLKMRNGQPLPEIQKVAGELTDCRIPHAKVDPCHNCDFIPDPPDLRQPSIDHMPDNGTHEGASDDPHMWGANLLPPDATPPGYTAEERYALHQGDRHHYAWRAGDRQRPEPAPAAPPAAAYGQAPAPVATPVPAPAPVAPSEPLRPGTWAANKVGRELRELGAIHILTGIGEDIERGGLLETPSRVAKAWLEWTSGYGIDPASILKVFEDGAEECDEMVVVRDIPVYSHCEHHMAAIFGTATVGYIPGEEKRIIGLSKMSRLVDIYAKRLQVQERMTNQIATAMMENLLPLGCGVVVKARHMCMESRGVKQAGTVTITSAMRGAFKNNPSTRAEFLALAR